MSTDAYRLSEASNLGLVPVHACNLPRTAIVVDKSCRFKNANWRKWQLVKTPSVR